MRTAHTIRSALAALAAAAALALTGASAAVAATASPPSGIPLVSANTNGWSNLSYRPGHIYVGQGGSPVVDKLAWGSWGYSAAITRAGRLTQYWPNGGPSYQWPYSRHPVVVYLHDPLVHQGQPYFAKMRWNWTNAHGKAKVAYWLMTGGFWSPR